MSEPPARAATSAVTIGGSFTLSAPDGTTVTDQTYRGKWLLVYFGYTFCPNSCPTTLLEIAAALKKLGPEAANVQPLFITVDPQRDTPQVMRQFTQSFDPRIVGLTGTPQQIAAVAQAYGAYYVRHRTGPGTDDYAMDHSTYLYVMDPQGKFVRAFDTNTSGDRIADALRELLASGSHQGAGGARGAAEQVASRQQARTIAVADMFDATARDGLNHNSMIEGVRQARCEKQIFCHNGHRGCADAQRVPRFHRVLQFAERCGGEAHRGGYAYQAIGEGGSLVRGDDLKIRFDVTDGSREIAVAYQGVLPDLFREGKGVVAEGALDGSGLFTADTILAKHDETYMPKDVADALKKSGHWKDDYGPSAAMRAGGAGK